jgi:outer membrane immunogenic protein
MKRFALAFSVFASTAVTAFAADLPPRMVTKAMAPAVVYDWTGLYAGANLGWSFGRSNTDYTIAGLPFGSTAQRMDGILGGLQAGYNWQHVRGIFGLEADIQATGQTGGSRLIDAIPGTPGTPDIPAVPGAPGIPCILFDPPAPACTPGTGIPGTPGTPAIPGTPGTPPVIGVVSYQNKLPWFGTFRGRAGFTPAEHWLIYATGGLAYGQVTTNEALNVNGASVLLNSNAFRLGWTAGAGIETAFWDRWSAKLEYLYVDFGSINDTLAGIAPISPVITHSRVTDHIVRLGINYRFGGPIVARY